MASHDQEIGVSPHLEPHDSGRFWLMLLDFQTHKNIQNYYCSTEISHINKEGFSSSGDRKEGTAKEGEIKCGQLQFLLCDNPLTLEQTETTTSAELRHFRLTTDNFDCFQKDSQVLY